MFFAHGMIVDVDLFTSSTFRDHVSEKLLIYVIVQIGQCDFDAWRLPDIILINDEPEILQRMCQ